MGAPPRLAARPLLVTGAAGQLGRDVVEAAAARGHGVIGFGREELDCTDARRVRAVVGALRPAAVIHCAAYTDVDGAEADPAAAHAGNAAATANVVDACQATGAYVVAVSTDYVFDGKSADGYAETDAPAPVNVYGESKLVAERAVLAVPAFAVARTAWLFGRSGSNFVRTIARLACERDAIDVVIDQVGSPTYARHLAVALVECAEQRLAGVLHLAGSPVATWYDVAQEVVRTLDAPCEVRATTSDAFPRPAPRPACSVLRATRADTPPVGDWRNGVREVIAEMSVAATTRGPAR